MPVDEIEKSTILSALKLMDCVHAKTLRIGLHDGAGKALFALTAARNEAAPVLEELLDGAGGDGIDEDMGIIDALDKATVPELLEAVLRRFDDPKTVPYRGVIGAQIEDLVRGAHARTTRGVQSPAETLGERTRRIQDALERALSVFGSLDCDDDTVYAHARNCVSAAHQTIEQGEKVSP